MENKKILFLVEPIFFGSRYTESCLELDIEPIIILRKEKENLIDIRDRIVLYTDVTSVENVISSIENFIQDRKIKDTEMGILQGNEYSGSVVSKVAKHFGWVGINYNASEISHYKNLMRLAIQKINPSLNPKFKICTGMNLEDNNIDGFKFPLVVKPINMTCSMLVKEVKNNSELIEQVQKIIKLDDNYGYNISSSYMIEELIDDQEYSFDGIMSNGECKFYGITKKITGEKPYFVEIQHSVPADLSSDDIKYINRNLIELLKDLGILQGPFHVEFRYNKRRIHVMEYASRLPGDCITDLYMYSYGVNLYKATIMNALGLECREYTQKTKSCHSTIKYFNKSAGYIEDIIGIEDAHKLDGVIELKLDKKIGEYIPILQSSMDRYGYYIIVQDSRDKLEYLENLIDEKITINMREES